jgi:hypothetical protein
MTHGTPTGYAKHGCRCVACTRAQRERMREYRKRRMNAVPTEAGATTPGTTQMCPGDVGASPGVAHEETAS